MTADREDARLLYGLVRAAVDSGRLIQEIRSQGFSTILKNDGSPTTTADLAAEALILERLALLTPAVPVVAEERHGADGSQPEHREFFLVDPLDGTREFVAGRGEYTVNIALVRDGRPVLGVVFAPECNQIYTGLVLSRLACRSSATGAPTAIGDAHPIRTRPVPSSGATAVTSRWHHGPATDRYLERLGVDRAVSLGSSLKFCRIAEGEADLYPRFGPTMEWDTAAGQAVLVAAGGSVRTSGGEELRYGKPAFRNPGFVASGRVPFASFADLE